MLRLYWAGKYRDNHQTRREKHSHTERSYRAATTGTARELLMSWENTARVSNLNTGGLSASHSANFGKVSSFTGIEERGEGGRITFVRQHLNTTLPSFSCNSLTTWNVFYPSFSDKNQIKFGWISNLNICSFSSSSCIAHRWSLQHNRSSWNWAKE